MILWILGHCHRQRTELRCQDDDASIPLAAGNAETGAKVQNRHNGAVEIDGAREDGRCQRNEEKRWRLDNFLDMRHIQSTGLHAQVEEENLFHFFLAFFGGELEAPDHLEQLLGKCRQVLGRTGHFRHRS
jgi:hypothetical protein